MSVEEMIASLEDQKLNCVKRYESAIQSLRGLRDLPEPHDPATHRKLTFEPIRIEGEPLSKTVIDARGPY